MSSGRRQVGSAAAIAHLLEMNQGGQRQVLALHPPQSTGLGISLDHRCPLNQRVPPPTSQLARRGARSDRHDTAHRLHLRLIRWGLLFGLRRTGNDRCHNQCDHRNGPYHQDPPLPSMR
ncbi:hypothetical protein Acry_3198 (plasmid) [Acidiphilium cryptum JF-5]|uniref:Uncharacterized protein n=1 Tax=Acidiphilium cryptum (strain JF-5) TaxID=349163 RepID=A5FT88_ACICJ|nr:hypothetical protein Acry_3198 [Acidiphilium cryptum JF-5]